MSQIRCIYTAEPDFPATDQHPDAERYNIGELWVDALDGKPTQDEIDAVLNPSPPAKTDFELMRDYIAAKPDAPAELKASAAEAAAVSASKPER